MFSYTPSVLSGRKWEIFRITAGGEGGRKGGGGMGRGRARYLIRALDGFICVFLVLSIITLPLKFAENLFGVVVSERRYVDYVSSQFTCTWM
jgi:hypothetical protein